MSVVVFAGPSLAGLPSASLDGVELSPPAACGDILRAVADGARSIGLIDGLFGEAASVWHKEILAALHGGIRVFGAASMGALRAAECHTFGMVGVGRIFEDYRSGARVSDADVAVLHAPAELGYSPLTVALVDAEATIEALDIGGRICRAEAEALLGSARAIGFRDRTWSTVAEGAKLPSRRCVEIANLLRAEERSLKREDAAALLAVLRDLPARPEEGSPLMKEDLSRTFFLTELERRLLPKPGCAS